LLGLEFDLRLHKDELVMDVFLSYAREDKEFASRLVKDLAAEGIEVWWDRTKLKPGENWVQALLDGIRSAPNFLALVSENTAASPHFSTELAAAIASKEASPRRIVPVLTKKNAPIPSFLNQFTVIDASTPERYRDGVQRLSKLINSPLPPPHILGQYDQLVPQIAEQIMALAEREELTLLESERRDYLRGRIFGLLALSVLVAAVVTVYAVKESSSAFFVMLGTVLIGMLASFIAGLSAARRWHTHDAAH
jgi:uncharacterized membrane protein